MTTIHSANTFNLAVKGTFDDCQDIVKALFADETFRHQVNMRCGKFYQLGAHHGANRLLFLRRPSFGRPRIVPYFFGANGQFWQCFCLCRPKNGLANDHLIVASNANDILTRFFESGTLQIEGVVPALSPSMDIQVSSILNAYYLTSSTKMVTKL